jgi:hypothetical protein
LFVAQEKNQYLAAKFEDFSFLFAGARREVESRASGNPSWNTDVDYKVQFAHSINQDEVKALYAAAGLDLNADLETLNRQARITASPAAVDYLASNIIFNGNIRVPVLTMHTTADGLIPNEHETAYADVVREAGNSHLLRETFVHRAGHCLFTSAETITALMDLIQRLDTGEWPDVDAGLLNQQATDLGPELNTSPASFIDYQPAKFPRPLDAFDAMRCASARGNLPICNGGH